MTLSDGPPPGTRKDDEDGEDCGKKLSLRPVLPQIAACIAANSFYLPDGAVLGYSAILIPQLELPDSEITVTRLQTAWLTSLMMLVVPVGEAVAVLLMERWGRVRALQLALVPFVMGSVVIAVADSFDLILVGKVLVGVSLGEVHQLRNTGAPAQSLKKEKKKKKKEVKTRAENLDFGLPL